MSRPVKPQGDLQAFFEAMRPYFAVARPGTRYTPEDRFRDFREVFYGSEAGKRVLAQIITECEDQPLTLTQVRDHPYMAFRAGKREVGLKITMWMQGVPPEVEIEGDGDE